jgi:hypothetical protein
VRSDEEYRKNAKAVLNTFNRWQEAEYNASVSRSRTAKQWNDFNENPVKNELYPNLKWLPSRSAHQREEHISFYNRVWAKNDPFWASNQPGTLWNCKCDWEETDEPTSGVTPDVQAAKGLKGNPGETGEAFSPDASYFTPNSLKNIPEMSYRDTLSEMKINVCADKKEIADNVRTGRILAQNKDVNTISIRQHVIDQSKGPVKNPEYEINGMIADGKRIENYKGINSGFNTALNQGCSCVIIDFNKHFDTTKTINVEKTVGRIIWRKMDFDNGKIKECYIVYGNKSVKITKYDMEKNKLIALIKGLLP